MCSRISCRVSLCILNWGLSAGNYITLERVCEVAMNAGKVNRCRNIEFRLIPSWDLLEEVPKCSASFKILIDLRSMTGAYVRDLGLDTHTSLAGQFLMSNG